jgi:hypothetical protein
MHAPVIAGADACRCECYDWGQFGQYRVRGSATFLQPIKYTAVRTAQFEIQLELTDLPGQTTSLTPQLSFVPHATEKAALKVARAKSCATGKYMQLTPNTKAMLQGAIV